MLFAKCHLLRGRSYAHCSPSAKHQAVHGVLFGRPFCKSRRMLDFLFLCGEHQLHYGTLDEGLRGYPDARRSSFKSRSIGFVERVIRRCAIGSSRCAKRLRNRFKAGHCRRHSSLDSSIFCRHCDVGILSRFSDQALPQS